MNNYFYTHIFYLLDFDINDVISFYIKYFFNEEKFCSLH